ncbi:head GIN domain-containing protein [Gramella sp. MAR_2010_147]|uniref:head GIN domain-containing protein n=1 Tax=Gramella sp. MAR_2010_147 TaxID=1250205 RepID=UPI000879460C|nr:head GIN domain-containing protein [Gramella sp. MAR_2010_147]SDR73182.1 Putative auto-transporter adhesin, head GIN domain [Gramella sp. MAR_2010_147]
MKKLFLFLTASLLFITTACAQWNSERIRGNGDMVTKTRNVGSYDGVQLVGSMNVELISGSEGNIKVQAESNLQEFITTEVKNGRLKISTKEGFNLNPKDDILIIVPVESIEEVSVTGSGDIWTKNKLKASNMKVQVTGSGDLVLDLEVKDLKGMVTGSGDVKLRGKSQNFECTVTGSGDFEAYDLQAENVEARVSGSGDIMVYASNSLKASVSGSGDIVYKGNPAKQDFKTHGSGSVSSH